MPADAEPADAEPADDEPAHDEPVRRRAVEQPEVVGHRVDPWALARRWPSLVAEEILLAPFTVRRLRTSLTDLPDKIDGLSTALEETTTLLTRSLGEVDRQLGEMGASVTRLEAAVAPLPEDLRAFRDALDRLLPELSGIVVGMDDRVRRVETTVVDLGEALFSVMGAIPGVRRALRDLPGQQAIPPFGDDPPKR